MNKLVVVNCVLTLTLFAFNPNDQHVNFIKGKPYLLPDGVTYSYLSNKNLADTYSKLFGIDCEAKDVLWIEKTLADKFYSTCNGQEKTKNECNETIRDIKLKGYTECVSKLTPEELNYIQKEAIVQKEMMLRLLNK